MEKEKKQEIVELIKIGAILDEDGYRGCPKCGSQRLTIDGVLYDETYLMCLDCGYSISGDYNEELVGRWNNIERINL